MKITNPIVKAIQNCTTEQFKAFVIKPEQKGYSHYRAMKKPDAEYWRAEAWFISHCIQVLGMTFEDFKTPTQTNPILEINPNKNAAQMA